MSTARRRLTWAAVLIALGACSESRRPAYGLDRRVEVPPLALPVGLPTPIPVQLTNAFPALVFDRPVFLAAPPDGDDRVVVVEQPGRVLLLPNDPAATAATVMLDIRSQVQFGGEEGLLGFAFHPDYAQNRWFYVCYTRGGPRRSVLSRFTVGAGNPDVADLSSETVLLEVPQPFANHNAGSLAFGPDGKLYVALGDGGSANDPANHAQNLTTLLGSILRLNDDGSVPADNPFVGGTSGERPEIWAYGLRNPWRISFDAAGRLWVGDVGQGALEEIDLIERGGNYGWRVYEGTRSNLNPDNLPAAAFRAPLHVYGRSQGISVTGGHVYRGSAVPALRGAYIYADFGSGRIWALVTDGDQVLQNVQIAATASPASFGEDRHGELFVCCFDGAIRRFVPDTTYTPPTAPPALLSAIGLFADVASLLPASGVLAYDVQSSLWSDGASKQRWLALPGQSRITFAADGPYAFPLGTALAKHFAIETAPGVVRRLETRVLVHQQSGWAGYTWRWRSDGSDAELVDEAGADDTFLVERDGVPVAQTWHFPGRGECLSCHTAAAGRVLGVRTQQLNRDFDFPLRRDNQLRTWNHIGLFAADIGQPGQYGALADPHDPSAPTAARARAYLAVNCGNCHLPLGPTPVDLDLRAGVPAAAMALFGAAAQSPLPGGPGLRATAGDRHASELWLRLGRRDAFGMPPLGSTVVDQFALGLIGAWIDGTPP